MTRATRAVGWMAAALALVATLAYLRDPPWLVQVTSGIGSWQVDAQGTRFRWTTRTRASLYFPADAALVTLPVRLGAARPDGGPVDVSLVVDGRTFSTLVLDEPGRWVPVTFALPRRPGRKRAVRVEVVVPRLLRRDNLGIQLGEPSIRR